MGRDRGQATDWLGGAHSSHCLCPDSEGVVVVNWHKQSDHPWIDRTHCVHTIVREDGIVSYLVGRGQGRAVSMLRGCV